MARLIAALLRHGDYHQQANTPSAHQPFPLTPKGEAQAREAANAVQAALTDLDLSLHPVIDSSNLLRAWQTAMLLAEGLGGGVTVAGFDALAERSVGSAANMTLNQITRVLVDDPRFETPPENWKADSRYRLPLLGAESLLEAGERVASHLNARMNALHDGGNGDIVKLFVGHGAAFRHAAFHLGVLPFERIADLSMFHARPVFLEVSQNGQWSHIAGEWKIRGKSGQSLD